MPETAVEDRPEQTLPDNAELEAHFAMPLAKNIAPHDQLNPKVEKKIAKSLLLTDEVLRQQGKSLFRELEKITDPDHSIHRRITKMWTSLTSRKTPDVNQELLWTQTKDVRYPTMEVSTPEDGGDVSTIEGHLDGDMVIEGYGDMSKKHVESYIVQLNRTKGQRDRHHKIRITQSGISLLTLNEDTNKFEPDSHFPERYLRELQLTIKQLQEKSNSST